MLSLEYYNGKSIFHNISRLTDIPASVPRYRPAKLPRRGVCEDAFEYYPRGHFAYRNVRQGYPACDRHHSRAQIDSQLMHSACYVALYMLLPVVPNLLILYANG